MYGQLSKARKLIAYVAISELGIASFEVEQILDVTQSEVSRVRSLKGIKLLASYSLFALCSRLRI